VLYYANNSNYCLYRTFNVYRSEFLVASVWANNKEHSDYCFDIFNFDQ